MPQKSDKGGGVYLKIIQRYFKDNFCYFSTKTYVVTPYKNLGKTVLLMGHNLCFCGQIWEIIPKLSLLPLLIWSTVITASVNRKVVTLETK